eukprot:g4068.t1
MLFSLSSSSSLSFTTTKCNSKGKHGNDSKRIEIESTESNEYIRKLTELYCLFPISKYEKSLAKAFLSLSTKNRFLTSDANVDNRNSATNSSHSQQQERSANPLLIGKTNASNGLYEQEKSATSLKKIRHLFDSHRLKPLFRMVAAYPRQKRTLDRLILKVNKHHRRFLSFYEFPRTLYAGVNFNFSFCVLEMEEDELNEFQTADRVPAVICKPPPRKRGKKRERRKDRDDLEQGERRSDAEGHGVIASFFDTLAQDRDERNQIQHDSVDFFMERFDHSHERVLTINIESTTSIGDSCIDDNKKSGNTNQKDTTTSSNETSTVAVAGMNHCCSTKETKSLWTTITSSQAGKQISSINVPGHAISQVGFYRLQIITSKEETKPSMKEKTKEENQRTALATMATTTTHGFTTKKKKNQAVLLELHFVVVNDKDEDDERDNNIDDYSDYNISEEEDEGNSGKIDLRAKIQNMFEGNDFYQQDEDDFEDEEDRYLEEEEENGFVVPDDVIEYESGYAENDSSESDIASYASSIDMTHDDDITDGEKKKKKKKKKKKFEERKNKTTHHLRKKRKKTNNKTKDKSVEIISVSDIDEDEREDDVVIDEEDSEKLDDSSGLNDSIFFRRKKRRRMKKRKTVLLDDDDEVDDDEESE